MSRPVTLVAWEDATKRKPKHAGVVLTDVGTAYCWGASAEGTWEFDSEGMEGPCEPSAWTDLPAPPGPDAFTVEDLRRAADGLQWATNNGYSYLPLKALDNTLARLARALDAFENGGTK